MRDLHNNILVKQVIASQTQTNSDTALVGAVIDHQGYDSAEYLINLGAMTDADVVGAVLLEESDSSGSDFAAVADADLLGTEAEAGFTFGDDGEVRKLGYKGNKRYTRLTITPTGNNSGALPIGALCILGNANLAPVTQSAT